MRTSNKILLGGFLAAILIITGIHAILYAKIKSGDLVSYSDELLDNTQQISLGNIKHLAVTGVIGCNIVPGDSAKMRVHKNHLNKFTYTVTGDTLRIDAGLTQNDYTQGGRKFISLTIELPVIETITADYCQVFLQGAADSSSAISTNILASNSELNIRAGSRELTPAYWKNLRLQSLHSQATFTAGAVVNELFVSLNAMSTLTDDGADLQHFSLQVDSTSTVSLRQKSLNNIKLVK